jgi:hypothetical protein
MTASKRPCSACKRLTPLIAFATFRTRSGDLRRRGVCRKCRDKYARENFDRLQTWRKNYEEEMFAIIRHASAIAGLATLLEVTNVQLQLGYHNGSIDAVWFAKHLGHDLIPRDEYGRCADRCGEYVRCAHCVANHRCALPLGHADEHRHKGMT